MPIVRVEAARKSVDIVKVLDRYDIRYERSPEEGYLHLICPFHEDQHFGSCSMRRYDGVWYCFSCGLGGNIYQFVARLEKRTVGEIQRLVDSDFAQDDNYEDATYEIPFTENPFFDYKYSQDVDILVARVVKKLKEGGAAPEVMADWLGICSWLKSPKIAIDDALCQHLPVLFGEFLDSLSNEKSA